MALAKVVIKGENQLGGAIKSAQQDMGKLQATASAVGKALKSAFAITAVLMSVKRIGTAINNCSKEFETADRAYRKLSLALGNESAFKQASANIKSLARVSMSSKGDIESVYAELAQLGKSSDEIDKIAKASVYLSEVTGKDLKSSMTTLLGTYNGTTTQLKKLGVSLDGVTDSELRNGMAVDKVLSQFSGYVEELAEGNTAQSVKNIKEMWGDIRQTIGGVADYLKRDVLGSFDTAFNAISTNIQNIIIYIGAVIKNLPAVLKTVGNLISDMISKTFEWDTIKKVFVGLFTNISILLDSLLKGFISSLPGYLEAIFNGIKTYLEYLALSIKNTILTSFEGAINELGQKGQSAWWGKLFNISKKMESFKVDPTGSNQKEIDAKYIEAKNSFGSAGGIITAGVKTAIESATNFITGVADVLGEAYAEPLNQFTNDLEAILKPTMDAMLIAVNYGNGQTGKAGGSGGSGSVGVAGTDSEGNGSDNPYKSLTDILSTLTGSLGIFGDMINGMAPGMAVLKEIAQAFVNTLAPALESVVAPIMDALDWIGQSLAELLLPILDAIYPVLYQIGEIIITVFAPVFQIIAPLMQVIANVLSTLTPLLATFSGVISWVMQIFSNLGIFLNNMISNFWSPGSWGNGIKWTSLQDSVNNAKNSLGSLSASIATDSASTTTAVSSAGYAGATAVTINIYQNSPVVGSNGMREFAQMLKDEFDNLSYYGVTI